MSGFFKCQISIFMKANVNIKLYAGLENHGSTALENYPIERETTIQDLLKKLNIPVLKAKLIFINGKKGDLTTVLKGGECVGIFPPLGGG